MPTIYALASRTKLAVKDFKCACFDDKKITLNLPLTTKTRKFNLFKYLPINYYLIENG
jgi:hypothetical protein